MSYHYENAQKITRALHGVWHGRYGLARCPAHDDQHPSLLIADGNNGRLLLHCYAGCAFKGIIGALAAMGLIGCGTHSVRKLEILENGGQNRDQTFSEKNFEKLPFSDQETARKKACKAQKIWKQAQPIKNSLAETYLRARGITCVLPQSLRFHKKCPHPSGICLPTMVALVEGSKSFAVHRTYLRDNGTKADIMPVKAMLGHVTGGVVHLSRGYGQHYVICEGIETGLALASGMLPEPVDILAALSTSGMMRLNLPEIKGRLTVAMDGDKAGRKAGYGLAERAHRQGFAVFMMEAPQGTDFNDVLLSQGRAV